LCPEFISGSARNGLQSVLGRYFETLKLTLANYSEDRDNKKEIINSVEFMELFIIQHRYLSDSLRRLVQVLKEEVNHDLDSRINRRVIFISCFIVAIIVGYFIIWLPFVNKLSHEMWRTKAMLTIIPIEVILKIQRIQEFLFNQNLFAASKQSSI